MIPVYIGDYEDATDSYNHYIHTQCHPTPLSDDPLGVRSVESDLLFHLESQAMGAPVEPTRSVGAVLHDITACPGDPLTHPPSHTLLPSYTPSHTPSYPPIHLLISTNTPSHTLHHTFSYPLTQPLIHLINTSHTHPLTHFFINPLIPSPPLTHILVPPLTPSNTPSHPL